jgi:Tol biopolymer transport system component
MSLTAGRSLSHYKLVAPIGEGGMGVVWRATDSTLGRDVAIKVLPEFLSGDPERLARFEREAKLLASLNHPHIASIFGFHSDGGVRFLAMELVEGEDLAQRLSRGAIPVAEALPLALQVAQALEHAHEKGVIHRDLKPANVKLTSGGQAKVLDFGLAKALEGDVAGSPMASSTASISPTLTGHMTGAHVLLGTAAYMSPEQARAQAADRRADIWGFGVLVLEMLTGKRTFEGETISDTLASVLKSDPDWSALPKDTPPRVRALLKRCLERNQKQRLRDIGEARILLDDVIAGRGEEPAAAAPATAPAAARGLPAWAVGLAALVLGAGVTYGITRSIAPTVVELPLRKFHLSAADAGGPPPVAPVISPDGRRVAYLQLGRLVIQSLDDLEPKTFKVDASASKLFWSPDGKAVGFIAGTRIMKQAVDGTEPQAVCDTRGAVSTGGWGACWKADGNIAFTRGDGDGLLEVSSSGGDPRPLLLPDSTQSDYHEPSELPGGRGLIFPAHGHTGGISTLWLWAGGKRKLLLKLPDQTIANPVYAASGHILFRRGPTTPGIWALPFSLSRLEPTGEPFLVAPGGTQPSVAGDGTLSYLAGGGDAVTQLIWTDAAGRELGTIGPPEEQGGISLSLSPDGRRIARGLTDNNNEDMFIYDVDRGTRTRLTFEPAREDAPAWSPRGDRIVYQAQLKGFSGANGFYIVSRAADGTGPSDTLAANGADPLFTPDGRHVTYIELAEGGGTWNLLEVPVESPHTPRLLVQGNPQVETGAVAPQGDLMAYMSRESGQWEIFLTRYPSCSGKWQVSTSGGQWPQWNAKGDRLYFAQGEDVMVVDVAHGASPVLGTPRKLFTRAPLGTYAFGWVTRFAVNGDGTRFVTLRNVDGKGAGPRITVVQNWVAGFAKAAKGK